MDRRGFIAGCLGLPLLARAGAAQAGLTRIIFPFAAGAGGDTLCRLIAQEMAPVLQRTIIVENRTGGDGLIGIKAVKGANPDGGTVLVTGGLYSAANTGSTEETYAQINSDGTVGSFNGATGVHTILSAGGKNLFNHAALGYVDANGVAHVLVLGGDDVNAPGKKRAEVWFY